MKILPAIDILGGACVRLTEGKFEDKTVYATDPVAVARDFERQGASMLHVVDLDAAKSGRPVNQELILRIAGAVRIPIEVGGGIRDIPTARAYLNQGVRKIIIGTKALDDPDFLSTLLREFGREKIVVAVETRDDNVVVRGWQETTKRNYLGFAKNLKALGVTEILFTDVERDGSMTEPNFTAIKTLVELGFSVTASGGIADVKSIEQLRDIGARSAILGKALYEHAIGLKEALRAAVPVSNLTKRIIPCLDVKDGRVVKGVHFNNLKDSGDPVELAKFYSEQGADELVFLDIAATQENRKPLRDLVKRIARAINIPFTVGGGVASLSDIRELLRVGAEKVSLGSVAVTNPSIVEAAARRFGSQCVVVSIDAKRSGARWNIYIHGGSKATGIDAVSFAEEMERLGAGELLVNSLDRDGTKKGFDIDLLNRICEAVKIPVIASSGAGSSGDFIQVFKETNVDAGLAASIFHNGEVPISDLKRALRDNNVRVRI
jgi:cyclase